MVVQHSDNDVQQRRSKGPHGLGDPEDTFLRKVEKNVLIPKLVRERSRKEKCFKEYSAFCACAKEQGLKVVFNCRQENEVMKDCLSKWFYNEEFREECKKQYLQERSEYRRTGIGKKQREAAAQAQSNS